MPEWDQVMGGGGLFLFFFFWFLVVLILCGYVKYIDAVKISG